MRHYYKQLYASKMDYLEEMDKALENYNLPRLNQEEIENINRPIISTEIETVIKNLPTTNVQDQKASQAKSIKQRKINTYPTETIQKNLWECNKISSKREVYSNTILPQEAREISNKQPNLTSKVTRERRINKTQI